MMLIKKIQEMKFPMKLLLITLLTILATFTLYQSFIPYYKVEDRVDKVKKYKGTQGEKVIGWVKVQGTNIDFPIVYYHSTDVTDPTRDLGWSFSDSTKLEKKMTLVSHNVLNVSRKPLIGNKDHRRFEQLMAYIYTDFVKENKYIQYTTDKGNYLYKIYAISFQKESELSYEDISPTKMEMKNYIKNAKNQSYFQFDINVSEKDQLLTLITCTRFFGETTDYSFVVDARRVRKNETLKNYKVKEKKNYDKIKKMMNGVGDYA